MQPGHCGLAAQGLSGQVLPIVPLSPASDNRFHLRYGRIPEKTEQTHHQGQGPETIARNTPKNTSTDNPEASRTMPTRRPVWSAIQPQMLGAMILVPMSTAMS